MSETPQKRFERDLAEYVKIEGREDEPYSKKLTAFRKLTQNYPHETDGSNGENGEYVFFPEEEQGGLQTEPINYRVRRPSPEPSERAEQPDEVKQDFVEYEQIEDALDKIMKLTEMEEKYDTRKKDDSIVFRNEGEKIEIGYPSLPELAQSLENREDYEFGDDSDVIREIAHSTSRTAGDYSGNILLRNGRCFVERPSQSGNGDMEMEEIDHPGDEIGLKELFEFYQKVRDDSHSETGREIFDSIRDVFSIPASGNDNVEIFYDSANSAAVVFDRDTVDIWTADAEEVEEIFFPNGSTFDLLDDMYDTVKDFQDDEG